MELMKRRGLPKPRTEYKFHPVRRFKFDFAYPDVKVAVEIEGGIFTGGAHGSASGILRDIEKYNLAAVNGWIVYRVPTKDVYKDFIFADIKKLLDNRSGVKN